MLLEERQTNISWDAEDKMCKMWTNDPAMIKRMDVLCEHRSGAFKCADKLGQSATYKFSSKLISFRFPTEDEMREEAEARIAARMRSKRSEQRKAARRGNV